MDRIWVTRELYSVHAVVRKMTPQPFDPFEVGGKPMLNDKIAAKDARLQAELENDQA